MKLKNKKLNGEVKKRKDNEISKDLEALKDREFLSARDAAVIVGCSTKTIYRLLSDGTIKGVNLSKRLIRINKKSLDKIIS
jgi:excisionase family DNA binding protein